MKRKARSAFLWLIGIIVVALGILRVVIPQPDSTATVQPPALTQFGPYHPGMTLREAFESLPPAGGEQSQLNLLNVNIEAWAARWRMLSEARKSIDISYFILREDVFGAALLGHLLKKAQDGVRIRMLLDSQGTVLSFTGRLGNDWIDTLSSTPNVELKMFRPLRSRYLEMLARINPVAAVASEHDKILVVDHTRGMIGGRNISAEYFADPADLPKAFEDVDVVLTGKNVARGLTTAFETQYLGKGAHALHRERIDLANYTEELLLAYHAMDAWLNATPLDTRFAQRIESLKLSWLHDLRKFPRSRGSHARAAAAAAQAETRLLDSQTRLTPGPDTIAQALARLAQSARTHILIQSPYLVLSEEAIKILEATGRRGVAITIYTNSPVSTDNAISQAFFLEQWPTLLARVPGLRLFVTGEPRTLHAKLLVFDDRVTLVGTYNLDPISMGINSEIMAAVWSDDFARRAATRPRARLARGAPLAYEYRIKRNRRGEPMLDERGQPMVAFGPKDHATPEQWRQTQVYWTLLRAADKVPGFSPLF